MPQFTIDLPEGAVARLKALVDRHNADQGSNLTLRDWIVLHLKEVAIARELAAAAEELRQQAERDAQRALEAALRAQRERLLAEM